MVVIAISALIEVDRLYNVMTVSGKLVDYGFRYSL